MRRIISALGLTVLFAACRQQQPVNVYVDPRFTDTKSSAGRVGEKIAVLEFTSSLNKADDPDNLAPKTMAPMLDEALSQRMDYKFIAPNTVRYAVDQNAWGDEYAAFLRHYADTDKPDVQFLAKLAGALQCDAFLVPVVDLWQKEEIEYDVSGTPKTHVGATITVIAASDGATLFRATDEEYLEGARTETGDRSVITGPSGAVYSDPGAKTHRAPPFEDVALKVVRNLAGSLPPR